MDAIDDAISQLEELQRLRVAVEDAAKEMRMLLNEGQMAGQALKEARRFFGVVNRWKCKGCGDISCDYQIKDGCEKCGKEKDVVVVIDRAESVQSRMS